MKTIFRGRPMLLALSLLLLTVGLSAQPRPDIAGDYSGEVFSSDGSVEMSMTLERVGRKYVGTYEMYEEGGTETGTLEQDAVLDPDVIVFTWKDKYGVGKLKVLFAGDKSGFYGYWSSGSDPMIYPWYGQKSEE